jgi:succinate dehydrogenase hydrophobic anchor subunit
MSFDAVCGIILIFLSLGFLLFLLFRSNRIIKLIHKKNLNSAREIQNKLNGK